jgi:DNA invertase Pin-like site-specific DNA recombinase
MDRRRKVELFEQIRREYRFGVGTIRGVAKQFGVHRRIVRQAMASAVPPHRKVPMRSQPKLEPVKEFIDKILQADQQAPRKRTTTSSFSQQIPVTIARVALYARVSTLNGQDPEMQLRELREYGSRRGWSVEKEYIDQGVSGSKESRPALNGLMSDAHRRKFDAVLVWKIDRFGRSLKHLVNSLAELGALGVAFVSFGDNLDLSTPSGRLMFQIIGAMAEFERALIQERVRAGLRNAQAKGKRLGRPRVVVDALRIASLRAQGRSWAEIVAEVKVGKGTAQRAVSGLPKIV